MKKQIRESMIKDDKSIREITQQWEQERQRQGIESYQAPLLSELENPEYAVKYLTACFEESSQEVFNACSQGRKR